VFQRAHLHVQGSELRHCIWGHGISQLSVERHLQLLTCVGRHAWGCLGSAVCYQPTQAALSCARQFQRAVLVRQVPCSAVW
jgi:hypothetical protein